MSDRLAAVLGRRASLRVYAHEDEARKAGMWFAAAAGNELAAGWWKKKGYPLQRAMAETPGSVGGFLVPVEMMDAIIALRELRGVFRRNARPVRMQADAAEVTRRTGGLTAYFTAEGASI